MHRVGELVGLAGAKLSWCCNGVRDCCCWRRCCCSTARLAATATCCSYLRRPDVEGLRRVMSASVRRRGAPARLRLRRAGAVAAPAPSGSSGGVGVVELGERAFVRRPSEHSHRKCTLSCQAAGAQLRACGAAWPPAPQAAPLIPSRTASYHYGKSARRCSHWPRDEFGAPSIHHKLARGLFQGAVAIHAPPGPWADRLRAGPVEWPSAFKCCRRWRRCGSGLGHNCH